MKKLINLVLILSLSSAFIIGCNNQITNTDKNNQTNTAYKAEGIYIGQVDPHSIEVTINGETKDFQISEVEAEFAALKLKEGDKIDITYIQDKNQVLLLKGISK